MATKTFGSASAPSSQLINFDSLFALSLANYRPGLVNNISKSSALFFNILEGGKGYESADGGTHIIEHLMYSHREGDWYDGYDLLSLDPEEGLTNVLFDWRQLARPVVISRKEMRQNAQSPRGVMSLLKAKIQQAELGIRHGFAKHSMHGNIDNGGLLTDPFVNPLNGASGIDPLPRLVHKDPTASLVVGNLDQSLAANSWWRNQAKESAATTTTAFLQEIDELITKCSLGVGGRPDTIVTDETTFGWIKIALYQRTRHEPESNQKFPFENIIFRGITLAIDEFMPDVHTGVANTDTFGTMYILNSQFFKVRYDSQTNFINIPPERPINQDAQASHILWMGNSTINNRRKHGVLFKIARTFTIE